MMFSMWISIFILTSPGVQESNRQVQWRTVVDSSFHVGFDCPANSSIETRRYLDSSSVLVLRVFCPDSVSPSFGNLLGKQTVLLAEFNTTEFSFLDAATDWGLTQHQTNWYIYANPGSGPSNKLKLVKSRSWTALKGYQSIGQNSSEGYAELAGVPYAFVFVKARGHRNVVMEVRYDSTASKMLDRIIQSLHVIEQ